MIVSPTASFLSKYGTFSLTSFQLSPSTVHIAMVMGDLSIEKPPLVRVQSACMTSTALGGIICDCADQMKLSFELIVSERQGVFLYLDEEGRGLGLHDKVITMAEMNHGADTVTAFTKRGLPADIRDYTDVGKMLSTLGVMKWIRLITNNPHKLESIKNQGFTIVERIPAEIPPTDLTYRYLLCKKNKLGHLLTMV